MYSASTGDAELARDGAGREDHRARQERLVVGFDAESAALVGELLDLGEGAELRAELLGMRVHQLADAGAVQALGHAGVVLDPVGRDDLPAGQRGLEHDRVRAGARSVEGGGEPGRASADDGDVDDLAHSDAPSRRSVTPAAVASFFNCSSRVLARVRISDRVVSPVVSLMTSCSWFAAPW